MFAAHGLGLVSGRQKWLRRHIELVALCLGTCELLEGKKGTVVVSVGAGSESEFWL